MITTNEDKARYDLGSEMVRILKERGPMCAPDLLPFVSARRPEVAYMMKALEARGRVRQVELPGRAYRGWAAVEDQCQSK